MVVLVMLTTVTRSRYQEIVAIILIFQITEILDKFFFSQRTILY